jgi:hypothetical protein
LFKKLFSLDMRVWSASTLNASFLGLELVTLIQTHHTKGLNLWMFVGFLYVQATFIQLGYKTKQWGLFWGMIASAIVSAIIVILIFVFRATRP